jgi:hypothetical protein
MRVEGARTLRKTLKAAGLSVDDLKAAHRAVAELVARAAHPAAPRRTGRLDQSVRTSGTQAAAIVRAGRAAVPYANPVHWGWPSHHIKANPWIQEAADRTEPAWSGLYLSALDAIVQTIEGAPGP